MSNPQGQANVLIGLADIAGTLDEDDEARSAFDRAARLYRQIDNKLDHANVLLGLGEFERVPGRIDQATTAYAEALTPSVKMAGTPALRCPIQRS